MRTRPVWMVTVVLRDSASHPRSGLKILVYLRDIQHDALPVRPVRLHQLLDVLLVTEQRHGSQCCYLCVRPLCFSKESPVRKLQQCCQNLSSITNSSELQLKFPFCISVNMHLQRLCGTVIAQKIHLVSHLWVEIGLLPRPLFEGHALDTTTFLQNGTKGTLGFISRQGGMQMRGFPLHCLIHLSTREL